jgi:hypothetical protein
MKKVRRKIGATIWNQEMARLYRAHNALRRCLREAVEECEHGPISAKVLLCILSKAALALNEAASALRELEVIVQSNQ